jgi:hypothetical protein
MPHVDRLNGRLWNGAVASDACISLGMTLYGMRSLRACEAAATHPADIRHSLNHFFTYTAFLSHGLLAVIKLPYPGARPSCYLHVASQHLNFVLKLQVMQGVLTGRQDWENDCLA